MIRIILRVIYNYLPYILISASIAIISFLLMVSLQPRSLNDIYITSFITNYSLLTNKKTVRQDINIDLLKQVRTFTYKTFTTNFRTLVLDQYLKQNRSPLMGLGGDFVRACDLYNGPEDCTTVIAIAKIETNLCKYLPSQSQKNCWGFGGSAENRYLFKSYSDGIDLVTKRLMKYYGTHLMINPNNMEMRYCGPRPSCSTWGDRVQLEMNNINELSIKMGFIPLYSLRTNLN